MLEVSKDGFYTCWTQNQFGLCSDKSPVSLPAAQLAGNEVEQTEYFKLLKAAEVCWVDQYFSLNEKLQWCKCPNLDVRIAEIAPASL